MVQIGTMAAFVLSPNRESWCPGKQRVEGGAQALRVVSLSFAVLCDSQVKPVPCKVMPGWVCPSYVDSVGCFLSRQTEKSDLCNPACFPLASPSSPLTFIHLTL